MTWLLAAQILVPLAGALVAFLVRGRPGWAAGVAMAVGGVLVVLAGGLLAVTAEHGVVAGTLGGWPAPFGIALVADGLAVAMVAVTAVIGAAVAVYARADIDARRTGLGWHALFLVMLAGVNGAFLTGDLFNLYVWFEVMLIASFGLLVLGGDRRQLIGGLRYVTLNLVSTLAFLLAIGLLYGLTGTLNLADLSGTVAGLGDSPRITLVAVLFLVAFGIKAAVFPLFFWLPASYHVPPVAVAAVFAGLLTKVGVYALIRVFTLVFPAETGVLDHLLLPVAVATMVTGVLGAAAQNEVRRILSFHIISQIGYMILGLALFTPLALAGAVFYLVHHIIVKANLFLIGGIAERLTGTDHLAASGGLYARTPWLAVLFFIPAFSLAGFPPLSGFWAKYLLIDAALRVEAWWVAAAALVVGLLTVYSMTKIWAAVFWKPQPAGAPATGTAGPMLMVPVAVLAGLTLAIGLMPAPLLALAETAAGQLLDPATYVAAVLGGSR